MKKLLKLLFVLLLFSCKGEPVKKEKIADSTSVDQKVAAVVSDDEKAGNCYDYLTELVRSSTFPFTEWKIDKKKVNLLIDEETDAIISCQLVFDTQGTGTVGWIEYHKEDGRLYNTSANLESPAELKYDIKWKRLFDSCLQDKKGNNGKTPKITSDNTLEKLYNQWEEIPLPNAYNYDAVVDEKGFQSLDKKYYQVFPIKHQDNYKIAKLPSINDNVKPVILITYNDAGQSSWYLFTLDHQYMPISNIILYTSEELGNSTSKATTYSISKDYKITVSQQSGDKITGKKVYSITKEGKII